jgi:hypothetical protein
MRAGSGRTPSRSELQETSPRDARHGGLIPTETRAAPCGRPSSLLDSPGGAPPPASPGVFGAAVAGLDAARPDWTGLLTDPAWRARLSPLLHLGSDPARVARHAASGVQYLATPYSRQVVDGDGRWCSLRSGVVAGLAAVEAERLRAVGVSAISPVVLADRMVRDGGVARHAPPVADPLDAAAWERWCRPLLFVSASVVVPDLPGWSSSRGVWREVIFALAHQRPVFVYASGEGSGDG